MFCHIHMKRMPRRLLEKLRSRKRKREDVPVEVEEAG